MAKFIFIIYHDEIRQIYSFSTRNDGVGRLNSTGNEGAFTITLNNISIYEKQFEGN